MISFVIKNGGPQPVQCCFTLAVCSAIFSLDSSQISMNKLKKGYSEHNNLLFFPDLVVARLSSACCSWRCQFPSSPVSLRLIQLSQYLGHSMVSPFPHSSKFPLFYVSLHPMGQFFASFSSPFFARSGNNGSRLPYLRRHDDLFVLCCRVNDPGRGGLHFQLVAGFGICQFLSFYRVI